MYKMRSLVIAMGAVFCAGALLLFPATAQAQECLPAPEGLVGWWPGDGDASDIQGANTGVLVGTTFAAGKVGQAFSFDGVDDFVEVVDSGNLNPTTAITLDAWVGPDTINPVSSRIVSKEISTTSCASPFVVYDLEVRDFSRARFFFSTSDNVLHTIVVTFQGHDPSVFTIMPPGPRGQS